MRVQQLIIAVLLTFVGTLFCGTLMTLPGVYASGPVHCETSSNHEHSHEPCHADSYDHHQLGSYTLQKNNLTIGNSGELARVVPYQATDSIVPLRQSTYQQAGRYELVRYHTKHIRVRKKE